MSDECPSPHVRKRAGVNVLALELHLGISVGLDQCHEPVTLNGSNQPRSMPSRGRELLQCTAWHTSHATTQMISGEVHHL
mmetsp:Transcript_2414/g.2978  ORF Transcript_2414/g.2978 Transcript_2414/m.2978 type:complete len:80 (-) Transcript_2414:290-529(-)